MAPSVIETIQDIVPDIKKNVASYSNGGSKTTPSYIAEPLKLTGVLDAYKSFDVTPVIGKEFPDANVVDWLRAPNSDELIRDLAITISQRGVVFFRAQNDLTNDLQKELIQRLGELAGKPKDSTLHIHPVLNSDREGGGSDPQISTISSEQFKKIYKTEIGSLSQKKQSGKAGWHSDITFEPVPSDYTSLRLTTIPESGGDTLWASGYEVYDRISTPYQRFLDSLTATFAQPGFNRAAAEGGFSLYDQPRGSPLNVGSDLKAIHPVVRTNPVTGWKSIFAVGVHCQHVNELTESESKHLLNWFLSLVVDNHDLQARLKWQNPNDLAIWDNRSVFHTATNDYDGVRFGNRAVGIGEKPYFDPASSSRREALLGRK